jgi:hypothetical protein
MWAIQYRIPYVTTIAAARASVDGIEAAREVSGHEPKSLQEYQNRNN